MKQSDSAGIRTDEELVRLAQGGDAESMDELIGRYKNLVKTRARSFFLFGSETEDVVQEGMIGLFKAIRDYDESKGASFQGFAKLCIYRQFYTAIKLASRPKHLPLNNYIPLNDVDDLEFIEQAESPEEALISREEAARFTDYLEKTLSPLENRILKDYLEGMSYGEIAEKQHVTKKAIDNALQRIRKKCFRPGAE